MGNHGLQSSVWFVGLVVGDAVHFVLVPPPASVRLLGEKGLQEDDEETPPHYHSLVEGGPDVHVDAGWLDGLHC